jgi:hypothetical protein
MPRSAGTISPGRSPYGLSTGMVMASKVAFSCLALPDFGNSGAPYECSSPASASGPVLVA